MSLLRHESQQYNTVALLQAETMPPTPNDEVHIEALNRRFNWLEGSTAVEDGLYVIDQVSETANGRWVATAVEGAKVYTGSAMTGNIGNGQSSVIYVTVTGPATLTAASGAAVGVINGVTFPKDVFVEAITITNDNTVQVEVVNQSGIAVTSFSVELKAIDFTGVAAATTAKQVAYGTKAESAHDGSGGGGVTTTVTFVTPFPTPPHVNVNATSAVVTGELPAPVGYSNVTTTGFTLYTGPVATASGYMNTAVAWEAIEKTVPAA